MKYQRSEKTDNKKIEKKGTKGGIQYKIRHDLWNEWGEKEMREIMNEAWRGLRLPEEWREGIICPIYKKGHRGDVKNYGGITLLTMAYKLYVGSFFRTDREKKWKG